MYRRISGGWVKHLDFMIWDMVSLQLAFVLGYWLRHGLVNPYGRELYRGVALFLGTADAVVLLMTGVLAGVLRRGMWKELRSCLYSAVVLALATMAYLFMMKLGEDCSRLVLVATFVFYFLLNLGGRLLWKAVLRHHGGSRSSASMLVAANRDNLRQVLAQLRESPYGVPTVTGVVLLDEAGPWHPETLEDLPVVANRDNLEDYICSNWVDELLVAGEEGESPDQSQSLLRQLDKIAASGVVVHRIIAMDLQESGRTQLVENFAGYTVLTDSVKIVSLRQAVVKRTMDICGGLVGCLICGLAMLVVGPMIYIQSPGPIIFKQKRVGRNGKIFTIYKMRSMVMDAEAQKQALMKENRNADGMMFKLDFDPRIIGAKRLPDGRVKKGIGNFIRDWSIDELPQFFNVLKGDMSLVGTRPPTLDEWEKYHLHHRARMAFRPGITGLWQVSGRSKITDFDQVVKLDMRYISNWDVGLDLRILLETVKVVLGRKGAM